MSKTSSVASAKLKKWLKTNTANDLGKYLQTLAPDVQVISVTLESIGGIMSYSNAGHKERLKSQKKWNKDIVSGKYKGGFKKLTKNEK